MRGTTMRFLGKENIQTPVLDKFSEESTVFKNAHIMGGSSGAVSMPSRAMLMTGKYLSNLESQGATIPRAHTLIGEVLQDAGYETFHTGKWHNGKSAFNRCFNSGKDIFFGGMADHWNVPLFNYDSTGEYKNTRRIINRPSANNTIDILQGEYVYSGKHSVDIFTETAVEFIQEQKDQEKPFFLSLCYMSLHDPRSTYDYFIKQYRPENITLPNNYMAQHPFDNGELNIRDEILAASPRVDVEIKKHIAEYYAMISHLDQRIGDVISALKANNLYENTIVIFTADNGLAVGQHGLLGKQNLYEHSINVPLMIKDVGGTKGQVSTNLCYLIDLYPSICRWIDRDTPASVDSDKIINLSDTKQSIRDYLYFLYRDCQRGVSDGEWKLIQYNVNGEKRLQLFNLKEDPMEMNDLSDNTKYNLRVKELTKKMLELKDETNDNSSFWK